MDNLVTLQYNECPHGTACITIDHDGCGHKLHSARCCGRWDMKNQWEMKERDLAELRDECNRLLRIVRRNKNAS